MMLDSVSLKFLLSTELLGYRDKRLGILSLGRHCSRRPAVGCCTCIESWRYVLMVFVSLPLALFKFSPGLHDTARWIGWAVGFKTSYKVFTELR